MNKMTTLFRRQKSIDELQAENDKVDLELSLAQKQAAIQKLKQAGLTPKDFGGRWKEIAAWLRNH